MAAIRNLTITLASQHCVISPVVNASHLAYTTLQTLQCIPDGMSSVVGAGEPVLTDALQSELVTVSAREKEEAGVVKTAPGEVCFNDMLFKDRVAGAALLCPQTPSEEGVAQN